jgi:hypothetical protein
MRSAIILLVSSLLFSTAAAPPNRQENKEDGKALWEAFRKAHKSSERFEKVALEVVKSRKLLGLTRKEVESKLEGPDSSDWFVHLGKPRFMGSRVCYTSPTANVDEYMSMGLFYRREKVYACYFGIFNRVSNKKSRNYHQESVGKPIN